MALPAVAGAIIGSVIAGLLWRFLLALFSGLTKFAGVIAIPLLWNMQIDWVKAIGERIQGLLASAGFNLEALQFYGLAAWVMELLRFGDCLALIAVALQVVIVQRVLLR